jgi:hypothetical protein
MQRQLNRQVKGFDAHLERLVLGNGSKAPEDVPRSGKAVKKLNGMFQS